jgi:phosphatidate cytidylyltransferase
MNSVLLRLFAIIFGLLALFTIIGLVLRLTVKGEGARAVIANMNARIVAWWIMSGTIAGALLSGFAATIILFAVISLLALREFITLTPTHRGDHRALFWIFFVVTPIQYLLIWRDWYGMFAILIPVYAFLFLPLRIAAAGDTTRFLERTAKIQWGLMVCVYCVSYAPALLILHIRGYNGREPALLLFLLVVAQLSDVFQYVWGKLLGKHKLAPHVSPNKTVEGLVGGGLTAAAIGTSLYWATPFAPWQAALLSLLIVLMGFAGGLVMSAIKRDRGVKDYGSVIIGHGGVMDRIDSLCFAAPIFFHAVRWFWAQ